MGTPTADGGPKQLDEAIRRFRGRLMVALRAGRLAQRLPSALPEAIRLVSRQRGNLLCDRQEIPEAKRQIGDDVGSSFVRDAGGRGLAQLHEFLRLPSL
jgi:hypothetical protein